MKPIHFDIIINPATYKPRHAFWIALKNVNHTHRFFAGKSGHYNTEHFEGRFEKGFAVDLWTYKFEPGKEITEQLLFIR